MDFIHNNLFHWRLTLDNLSSFERQLKYKQTIPFVHVPYELMAQWDNLVRMLNEVQAYHQIFSLEEINHIMHFNKLIEEIHQSHQGRMLDVDEIFASKEWQHIASEATHLREFLKRVLG